MMAQLREKIKSDIRYYDELRIQAESTEDYEQCAKYRDKIKNLKEYLDAAK